MKEHLAYSGTGLQKLKDLARRKDNKKQRGDPDKNFACDCRYFYSHRHKTPLFWNSPSCKSSMFKLVS